jgi:hypothetical protein
MLKTKRTNIPGRQIDDGSLDNSDNMVHRQGVVQFHHALERQVDEDPLISPKQAWTVRSLYGRHI